MRFILLFMRQQSTRIIVSVLSILLFCTVFILYIKSYSSLQHAKQTILELENRMLIQTEQQEVFTLAEAMQIVPSDAVITGGSKLSENIFWVSGETVTDAQQKNIQLWIVDVPAGSAVLIAKRSFSIQDSVVFSVDTSTVIDHFAAIETQVSTDTALKIFTDIVDIRTGEILAQLFWDNGERVQITKENKTLDIFFSLSLCNKKRDGSIVNTSHLETNEGFIALSHPIKITCIADTLLDTIHPVDFGMPMYIRLSEEQKEFVELIVQDDETILIDIKNLSPKNVSLEDAL